MKLKITVDGKTYEVDVDAAEPEQPHVGYVPPGGHSARATKVPATAPPKSAATRPAADESKVCRSPIAGIVVRVSAQVGQQIQANDVLIVLEAMKMETVVTAPTAAKSPKSTCRPAIRSERADIH